MMAIMAVALVLCLRSDGVERLKYYWVPNITLLSAVPIVYLGMSCERSFVIGLYLGYIIIASAVFLSIPRIYAEYLFRKYGPERCEELEDFLRSVSGSQNSKLYLLSTSEPKAFTLGKDVFVSAGMVEMLSDDELKAVIAHEAFHVMQNRFPLIKNLRVMTFLPSINFEGMADEFAAKIVGKETLLAARMKVRAVC
jgi:heat shock protein HtpX